MTIEDKINELNEYVGRSLNISHYSEWELHSHHNKTLFEYPYKDLKAPTFSELIARAYELMQEDKKKRGGKVNETKT